MTTVIQLLRKVGAGSRPHPILETVSLARMRNVTHAVCQQDPLRESQHAAMNGKILLRLSTASHS